MRFRRIVVLLNKRSGTVLDMGVVPAVERIRSRLGQLSHDVEVKAVDGREIADLVKEHSRENGVLLVVGGGDGTITTAVRNLDDGCDAMAILPLGTMNLLAKDLGMDGGLDECLRQLQEGERRSIDVAEVNGILYTSNAHLGVYPRVGKAREERRGQPRWRKWPALLREAIRVLVNYPLLDVELVDAQERRHRFRTRFVSVTNNAYDDARPGAFPRRSRLDRGELAVYVFDFQSRWRLILSLFSLFSGRWRDAPNIRELRTRELTIRTRSRRTRRLLVDGELLRLKPPLQFRCHPGALKLLAPPIYSKAER